MLENLLDIGMGLYGDMKADKRLKSQQRFAQKQFDAQMDTSVQRRVKDATQAGVHPLFALGASVGASPTLSAGGSGSQGSALGAAASRVADRIAAKEIKDAEIGKAKAAAGRDHAEALYLNSLRKRAEQEMGTRGSDQVKTFPMAEDPTLPMGEPVFYQPEIPKHDPSNPGIVAGTRPGEVRVRLADGSNVKIYDPDLGLDEIGQVYYVWQRVLHYDRKASKWTKAQIKKGWQHAKDIARNMGNSPSRSGWPRN